MVLPMTMVFWFCGWVTAPSKPRSASWNFGFAVAALVSGWLIATTGSYTPAYVAVGIFCGLSVLVYVVNYGWRGVERRGSGDAVETQPLASSPVSPDL